MPPPWQGSGLWGHPGATLPALSSQTGTGATAFEWQGPSFNTRMGRHLMHGSAGCTLLSPQHHQGHRVSVPMHRAKVLTLSPS